MPTPFPHTCQITRPGNDTRPIDPESGQPVGDPPDPVEVYVGRCYLDESGEAIRREKGGDTDIEGESVLRLPKRAGVFDSEADSVTVAANGVTRTARIVREKYLRHRVHLLLTYETLAA